METFLGIMIPFLGTTLGAACVFFMKKSLGDLVQRALAGFAAVDDDGQPRAVDAWTPETPGDIALAQRVKAHIDAAQ